MTISWTAVENAIQAWVVAGSGLVGSKVIWAQQNSPRPDGTYIALRVTYIRRLGLDWLDVLDSDPVTPGAEIRQIARGVRECTLNIQCYNGDPMGDNSATARLHSVVSYAKFPSLRNMLNAAGVGLAHFESVNSIDGFTGVAGIFEPRSTLDCTFFLASEVVETNTYIQAVQEIGTVTDEQGNDTTFSNFAGTTPAPQGLAAVPGVAQNTITWDDTGEIAADSFNLYWDTSPGVTVLTGTKIANITSPYLHTGLTPTIPYFYILTAVNSDMGESDPSDEVTATPT